LLVATLLATRVPDAPAQGQGPAPDNPLALFQKMVPVFHHPRCSNCHGGTFPEVPQNHPQRVEPEEDCTNCHDTAPKWTQERAANFVGQSAIQLCQLMAMFVTANGPDKFRHHIHTDELILQAFTGLNGGAAPRPRPVPPLTHPQFRDAAVAWLDEGLGMCDREGEIRYVEKIESNEGYPPGPSPWTRVKQAGTRTVTIRFADGRYQSTVQVEGSVLIEKTIKAVVNGRECQSVITSTTSYADVDDQTPGSFNLGITRAARVAIRFGSSGKYTVTVALPAEKHRHIDGGSYVDGCGVPLPPGEHDNAVTEWPGTSFTFEGTLPDPLDRRQLRGNSTRTVTRRGVSGPDDPWLWDHYAAAAPLDRPALHPVTVTVNWNFRYRP
jgi:hypothetical protein